MFLFYVNNIIIILVKMWHISSCLVWFGVIFIRHGLYQDGVFKFTVYIPDNYPDGDCPVSSSQLFTKSYFCLWCGFWVLISSWFLVLKHLQLLFWSMFFCFVSEISIWHPCFSSSCWPRVWRAWCQKSFHQMEVQTHEEPVAPKKTCRPMQLPLHKMNNNHGLYL